MTTENDTTSPPTRQNPIEQFSTFYEKMSNGDQAEVRRGRLSEPFWRALHHIGEAEAPSDRIQQWRVLFQLVAIGGYSRVDFGKALYQANYSEARLTRLLEADEQLADILRRTARQLASADQPANWDAARKLLFYNGDHAERVRIEIAQQYFGTRFQDSNNSDE
ncbi:type I-E CRISPR-associated protein Cse2/CasB [Salinibacter ruber]|uniref:type I-E CRISPR-associated protein Cse2/CasB n=1 Tax=Salinibacter ruber TaxID=146919 RepID=UPI002072B96A|nr:type I-E CRISPR-associated protein Cse2/CasB [Salinibacter ruber]